MFRCLTGRFDAELHIQYLFRIDATDLAVGNNQGGGAYHLCISKATPRLDPTSRTLHQAAQPGFLLCAGFSPRLK